MKQLYYVNGKRVDINTYANALNAEIAAEEAQNVSKLRRRDLLNILIRTLLLFQNGKILLFHQSQLYGLSLILGAVLMIVNCC